MPCLIVILLVVELCNTTECKFMRVLCPPQYRIKESVHQHINFKHHTKTISTNPRDLQCTITKLVLVEFVNRKHNTTILLDSRKTQDSTSPNSQPVEESFSYLYMYHPIEQHAKLPCPMSAVQSSTSSALDFFTSEQSQTMLFMEYVV